jgi:drug/metabolite transporter (DMT)-like permease
MAVDAVGAGLCGAFGFGCADVAGGRATLVLRAAPTAAIAQCAALAATLMVGLMQAAEVPGVSAAAVAVVAGVAYAIGLMLLYRGFAEGSIGLVAPSSGLVTVLIPVVADLVLSGRPSDMRVLGLVAAVLSVVLLASSTGQGSRARFSLVIGSLSGLAFGSADLALALLPARDIPGSLCIIRLVAALCAVALILPRSRAARPAPRPWTQRGWDAVMLAIAAGLLDALGHQGFALSASTGAIAVAAALTALHPLVSVTLGALLLKDSISRRQWLGSLTGIASMALLVI